MTNKEFQALVDSDIRRLMKRAEDQIIAENLQKLISRGTIQMNDLTEREWDREDMLDEEIDTELDQAMEDYKEDLKDRYDQMKGR